MGNLSTCRPRFVPPSCNNNNEAGVRCERKICCLLHLLRISLALCTDGEVQLISSYSKAYGTVRVCINGTWSKICGSGNTVLDNNMASVICTNAGYSPYGNSIVT